MRLLPVLLLLLFLFSSPAASHHPHHDAGHHKPPQCPDKVNDHLVTSVCARTQYPDVCASSARSHARSAAIHLEGAPLVLSVLATTLADSTTSARNDLGSVSVERVANQCRQNYDDALRNVNGARAAVERNDKQGAGHGFGAAAADYNACARSFMEMPGGGSHAKKVELLEKMSSNCLGVLRSF